MSESQESSSLLISLSSVACIKNEGKWRRDARMTLHRNHHAVPDVRKRQSTLSSALVRCVCITVSLVATGCALLGLGLTCFLLPVLEEGAAGCPNKLTVAVFGAAGGLLGGGLLLVLLVCRRRRRLKREALLDDLPEVCGGGAPQYKKKMSAEGQVPDPGADGKGSDAGSASSPPAEPLTSDEGDNFEMTQISADVSHWIEQQESSALPAASESFCLEVAGGATSHHTEQENSEGESTAL